MSLGCFRVVTIAREYGSGGSTIAAALAERLGFELLDRKLIDRIAHAARVAPAVAERLDERVERWLDRIGRALRFGSFEAVGGEAAPDVVDPQAVAELSAKIVREAAGVGRCVIVGRAAQCVLRDRTDVFHVFVYASRDVRLRNLRTRLGSGQRLELALDTVDQERAAYVRQHFGCDRYDRHLYQLMVNGDLGAAAAVAAIVAAMENGILGYA